VASGDMTQEVMKLKKHSGKDLIAHGGAGFAQTGLIDEFWFLTHPVALGHGLPLFSLLPKPLYLKLVSVTAFRSGAVAHVYQRSAAG
jgi:dihydrofolate reductase